MSDMLPLHLARTLQAERERRIRDRIKRVPGTPSGRRHPAGPGPGAEPRT